MSDLTAHAAISHPFGDVRPFFDQLAQFSARVFKRMGLPETGSPWGRAMTSPLLMKGVVAHYSASADMRSPLRWLCDPKLNPQGKESCHVIIGRAKHDFAAGLDHDLPLVQALPVTVVQVRFPNTLANHATWTNGHTYGIENESTGIAKAGGGVDVFGDTWATYTVPQLQANVALIQAYNAYCGNVFQPAWVLGHEHVETARTVGCPVNKRDPGPLYPMKEVREAVFGARMPGGVLSGKQPLAWAAVTSRAALAALYFNAGNGNKPPSETEDLYALDLVLRMMKHPISDASANGLICWAKLCMGLLGYIASRPDVPKLDAYETVSLGIVQRALGLNVDGKLGPKTLGALQARVRDRLGDSLDIGRVLEFRLQNPPISVA
ncbi:MAG: hypothetical protein EOO40_00425 [Deltaproteobacteria bacterium]|nr:MAG: hypothetical protein EOO40_00425 [Deltaproteobacteria bacterium]